MNGMYVCACVCVRSGNVSNRLKNWSHTLATNLKIENIIEQSNVLSWHAF